MEPLNPSESVQRYGLGDDAAHYVMGALRGRGPIADAISRIFRVHDPFTFLPRGLDRSAVSSFSAGGYCRFQADFWASWINGSGAVAAVAENYERKKGSKFLSQLTNYFFADEVLYYFAILADGSDVRRLFNEMSRYKSIIILLKSSRDLPSQASLAPDQLLGVAGSATHVLVGAYDEESFVVAPLIPVEIGDAPRV